MKKFTFEISRTLSDGTILTGILTIRAKDKRRAINALHNMIVDMVEFKCLK